MLSLTTQGVGHGVEWVTQANFHWVKAVDCDMFQTCELLGQHHWGETPTEKEQLPCLNSFNPEQEHKTMSILKCSQNCTSLMAAVSCPTGQSTGQEFSKLTSHEQIQRDESPPPLSEEHFCRLLYEWQEEHIHLSWVCFSML